MNKEEFDIPRQWKPSKGNAALDLVTGLGGRQYGPLRPKIKSKEDLEFYAEEELVRKEKFDEMRCEMRGQPRSTFLMVFSPDGSRVASTHGNHNIYVTDIRTGKNIKTLEGHPRTPWCIAFHPTSNQIVASGCLGGQVRIWDLSGGSEVWTTSKQTVIASIAFHPNDRILVIATCNEVYFWDWSQPEPFVHASTSNPKEKVRYVAFDKLGHKLITGIANCPQPRWERVRAPVPVPRQERCASPYRRRITQRLVNNMGPAHSNNMPQEMSSYPREPMSSVPERERRITVCYRNLVREYEQLVHRYLQLYRPPTMIDCGTDPMEPSAFNNSGTQTPEPSTSGTQPGPNTSNPGSSGTSSQNSIQNSNQNNSNPQQNEISSPRSPQPGPSGLQSPATFKKSDDKHKGKSSKSGGSKKDEGNAGGSQDQAGSSQGLITPSRIFCFVKKPNTLIRSTQTQEVRKHKTEEGEEAGPSQEKRFKGDGKPPDDSESKKSRPPNIDEPTTSSAPDPPLASTEEPQTSQQNPTETENGTENSNSKDSKVLLVSLQRLRPEDIPPSDGTSSTTANTNSDPDTSNRRKLRISSRFRNKKPETNDTYMNELLETYDYLLKRVSNPNYPASNSGTSNNTSQGPSTSSTSSNTNNITQPEPSTSTAGTSESTTSGRDVDELVAYIRRTVVEEVRNRILPIITSVPPNERPELFRLFENNREQVKMRFRQMYPNYQKKNPRRPIIVDSSSDNTSSDDEQPSTSQASQNVNVPAENNNNNNPIPPSVPSTSSAGVRNFNTELEQLVTRLLTEIERNETTGSTTNSPTTRNNFSVPNSTSSSARTRLNPIPSQPSPIDLSRDEPPDPSPSAELDNLYFEDLLHMHRNETDPSTTNSNNLTIATTPSGTRATTTSPFNTMSRRRFFSHRVSAFMPTRVRLGQQANPRNRRTMYPLNRLPPPRSSGSSSSLFGLDELVNYSERENSEDDIPPSGSGPYYAPLDVPNMSSENIGIGNMYSNILQDLESSLNDVRNIRASSRLGEMSDILSTFSDRLENIMNQSNTILRNLRSSLDMLPNISEANRTQNSSESLYNFNDPSFYVRDLRTEASTSQNNDDINNIHATSDHTYPRNMNNGTNQRSEEMLPLINSLVLTITHIQQQARLLRQQVESIERIDRAMLEIAQLQLIRQLIVHLLRHHRTYTSNEGRNTTGMNSVRQMMAGTRISDSSPYDSPSEEQSSSSQPLNLAPTRPRDEPDLSMPSTSSGNSSEVPANRPRSSNRKTYPPSRLFRLARHTPRKAPIISIHHWVSRRYMNRFDRGVRPNQSSRSATSSRGPVGAHSSGINNNNSSEPSSSFSGIQPIFNYSIINSSTLSLMTRRLEHLLMEQMRSFLYRNEAPGTSRSTASIDLGEHILALRLHGCLLRMNRVMGISLGSGTSRNLRNDATSAVTQDGASRYGARHTLSLIVDGMSHHIEETGNSSIPHSTRMQIRGVLGTSLLLTELLLLQVVDSVPPPTGMNLAPERESLTNQIDLICTQMLQSRFSGSSQQLTRSLRLMKLTMRHAYRALGQTYTARRNAMMPTRDTDRRQLLGSINRCLRTMHMRRPSTTSGVPPRSNVASQNQPSTSGGNENNNNNNRGEGESERTSSGEYNSEAWYSTVNELITRYSLNADDEINEPSTSGIRERAGLSSNNDNSEDDDEPDWYRNNNSSSPNSNLYRTNNVNLLPNSEQSNPPRPWNVPSVEPTLEPGPDRGVYSQRRWNPIGLFRPRFLPHQMYSDLDDPQREHIYDSDIISTTVTPNHRIQAWDISNWCVPAISNSLKNIVVNECKIHNDASVDVAKDGTILVTLLPSGGYLNVMNRLGVYSLRWETLGQCLFTTSFEQSAVSVSLSPLARHLVVGLASRRVSIVPSDRWIMARIFRIEQRDGARDLFQDRPSVLRELEQTRESRINCIRWLPSSGQGLIYATNTGQLVVLS